ncbi:defensin [Artemisia annua]|uniref:Defensin n=1 Tax=Artemisia annua TaxID=35608 RepID=A0A2U1NC74_ARTAN|nr:defensin [Artemisia annua]
MEINRYLHPVLRLILLRKESASYSISKKRHVLKVFNCVLLHFSYYITSLRWQIWWAERVGRQVKKGTNDNACHPPTHLKGLHNNVNSNGATSMEGTYDNASQPPASNYEPTKITTQQHHKKRFIILKTCPGISLQFSRTMNFGSQKKQTGSHIRRELRSNFVGFLALVPLRKIIIIDDKLTYPNRSAMPGLINGFHKRKQDCQAEIVTLKESCARKQARHGLEFVGKQTTVAINASSGRMQPMKLATHGFLDGRGYKSAQLRVLYKQWGGESVMTFHGVDSVASMVFICISFSLTGAAQCAEAAEATGAKRDHLASVVSSSEIDCDLEGELCEKASKTWAGICGKTNHCSDQCKSWENAAHEACHTRAGKHIATSNVLEPQICLKAKVFVTIHRVNVYWASSYGRLGG